MARAPTPDPLLARPLTDEAFRRYGDVIALGLGAVHTINAGLCLRHHDLARPQITSGAVGISLFEAQIRPLPCHVDLLERHPEGSQAFLPIGGSDYLVIVAPDDGDVPGQPEAFVACADQGVQYARGTWHGVLAPISGSGLFAVVDRIGAGPNLQEHRLPRPLSVALPG